MALKKCKECGNENAASAATCPKCGANLKMGLGKKILIGVGALMMLSIIASIGGKKDGGTTVSAAAIQGAATGSRERLEFGQPTVKTTMGMTKVDVEAKNVSGKDIRSCMLTATFKKGGTIAGTANGAVNQLPSGETRTAQLITTDAVDGYDTLRLEASTCF